MCKIKFCGKKDVYVVYYGFEICERCWNKYDDLKGLLGIKDEPKPVPIEPVIKKPIENQEEEKSNDLSKWIK